MAVDHSVYPDVEPPVTLRTREDRADYVARICGAWDFGLVPTEGTLALFSGWRDIFDAFPIRNSPAYAAFRTVFGWPPVKGRVLQANWESRDDPSRPRDDQEPFV